MVRGYSSPSLPGTSVSCLATAGGPYGAGFARDGESLARLGPAQQETHVSSVMLLQKNYDHHHSGPGVMMEGAAGPES